MSSNPTGVLSHAAVWIGRGVMIELVRRKDVYVLGMLMIVFGIGALAVRMAGIESAATGTFVLNLGLTLAHIFAHVLTLLLAARQIPTEIENRTMYPILARAVARHEVLLGKWIACTLAGTIAYALFFSMVWFTAPHMESYNAFLLIQAFALQVLSLGLTAALAILLSLLVPKSVAILLLAVLLFLGNTIMGFVISAFSASKIAPLARWLLLYLPDFSKLNLTTRYTDGLGMLSGSMFLGLLAYGLCFIAMAAWISHLAFRRRVL